MGESENMTEKLELMLRYYKCEYPWCASTKRNSCVGCGARHRQKMPKKKAEMGFRGTERISGEEKAETETS